MQEILTFKGYFSEYIFHNDFYSNYSSYELLEKQDFSFAGATLVIRGLLVHEKETSSGYSHNSSFNALDSGNSGRG
jgi:hypothetical protein